MKGGEAGPSRPQAQPKGAFPSQPRQGRLSESASRRAPFRVMVLLVESSTRGRVPHRQPRPQYNTATQAETRPADHKSFSLPLPLPLPPSLPPSLWLRWPKTRMQVRRRRPGRPVMRTQDRRQTAGERSLQMPAQRAPFRVSLAKAFPRLGAGRGGGGWMDG